MLNREAFASIIVGLAETFGRELSGPAISIYYAALRDLDDESWRRALAGAATSCKHMPTPAELRALSGEHSAAERSITAWTEATTAAAKVGSYRSVRFEDPAINAAIRSLGGWVEFCAAESGELERFVRPRFLEAHRAYSRSVPATLAAALPGLAERGVIRGRVQLVEVLATTPLPGGGPRVLDAGTLPLQLPPGGA